MTSKLVLDRQKAARSIIEAAATHTPAIDTGFAAVAKGTRHRGATPSVAGVLGFLTEVLEHHTTGLVDADAALARELRDDAEPRERRDATSTAIYDELTEIRSTVAGGAGEVAVRELGFLGDTPHDPVAQVTLARNVATAAAEMKLKPRRKGVKLEITELVAGLTDLATKLEQATRDVAREEGERRAALAARDTALVVWNSAYQGLAGALEGLLTSAGRDDLAASVRPVLRRGGGGRTGDAETGDGEATETDKKPA